MKKLDQLDPDVLEALRRMKHTDEEISEMSVAEAFSEYCEWYGFHGWAATLIGVLKNLEECE